MKKGSVLYIVRVIVLVVLLIWGGRFCKSQFVYSQDVFFNEVMQSNVDYLLVDHDYPDSWVELYNSSDETIDIKGFYMGLTSDYKVAYCIPDATPIAPKSHILIYCDKVNQGLHTNFRIDSGKGDLYLFASNGKLIDELHLKKMPAPNVAFGRLSDGSEKWQYEIEPSPGEPNNGNVSAIVLPDPVFSASGGIFESPITLTISLPDSTLPEDTKIYVTLDGSEPTVLSESETSFIINISKTTVVRAKLISSKALPTRSVTNTYIFNQSTTLLPLISIVTDSTHLYSDDNGILVGGFNEYSSNCYKNWRRPLNIEYYSPNPNDATELNQLCEAAVAGNYSRAYPQKSLKLYAHKRFGTKRFNGYFWDDKPNVSKVKSFKIRNYGTGNLYGKFHDAAIQTLFGRNVENVDWLAYQPVLLYINGKFSGIYELRERSDEDYVEANYGGLEDIERDDHEVFYDAAAREGTLFKSFYEAYTNPQTTYQEMANMMDVDNFLKVLAAEMFTTNYDYPQNNVSVWRETKQNAKWRWIMKDLDYIGMRLPVTWNMFNYMFQTGPQDSDEYYEATRTERCYNSHELYKRMIAFPEFKERFISLLSVYLGDFLKPSYTIPFLEKMNEEIISEIKPTFDANPGYSNYYGTYEQFAEYDSIINPVDHYLAAFEGMKDFYRERPAIVYQQMADYFSLGAPIKFTVYSDGELVSMDDIVLNTDYYDGYCFSDRSLTISANNTNMNWDVIIEYTDGTTAVHNKPTPSFVVRVKEFERDVDRIRRISCRLKKKATSVQAVEPRSDVTDYYSIRGDRLASPRQGVNILKMQDGSAKKVIRK